jgi:tRNA (adenine37-N6)-methyltransferase
VRLEGKLDQASIEFRFEPIGFVENDFTETVSDPDRFAGTVSRIRLLPSLERGLYRIETSSRICVIFAFDRSEGFELVIHPRGDPERPEKGVFATRSPRRPNPIGLTAVDLIGVDGNILTVRGLDAIDGTPVLDIKPCDD